MKRCLFFFFAFLLSVALAVLSEAPPIKNAEVKALANHSEVAGQEVPDRTVPWSAHEFNKDGKSQSSKAP